MDSAIVTVPAMNHDEYVRQRIISTAQAILDGTVGIIEGSVAMSRISHQAVAVWHEDNEFRIFGLISSETDHLPTGSARQYWNPVALAREDKEIAEIEDDIRNDVLTACRNLIERFKTRDDRSSDA